MAAKIEETDTNRSMTCPWCDFSTTDEALLDTHLLNESSQLPHPPIDPEDLVTMGEPAPEVLVFCECGAGETLRDFRLHLEQEHDGEPSADYLKVPADSDFKPLPDDETMGELLADVWGHNPIEA